jgi:hypothetical protein
MSLAVPTAPSTSDYTKTSYTFSDGANKCTITDIQTLAGDPEYNANVTYYYTESVYKGILNTRTDLPVSLNSGVYWLSSTKLSETDPVNDSDMAAISQITTDVPTSSIATAYNNYESGTSSSLDIYQYTTTSGTTYYISKTNLDANIADPSTPVNLGYAANIDEKVYNTEKAYLTKEDSGRYSKIELENSSSSFELTATSAVDEVAYQDAMSEYEYQQANYEKQIQDLNAKTETIQQEDKVLELKLRQLDTEQQALSTEIDSVKKVLDKNIEQTFKTFQ